MDVPQFIFELFEKELKNIQKDLLKKVATKYNLNYDNLIQEFIPNTLTLVSNTKTSIEIKKKNVSFTPPTCDKRCMARVWNRGKGGQCIRYRINDTNNNYEYCSQHQKNRKHGRIDELPNQNIFPKDSKAIYK